MSWLPAISSTRGSARRRWISSRRSRPRSSAKGLPTRPFRRCETRRLLAPDDSALKAHLARAFVARGDLTTAAEYLTVETAGNDPHLLLTVAADWPACRQTGRRPGHRAPSLEEDSSRRDEIAAHRLEHRGTDPRGRAYHRGLAADNALAQSDWAAAAAVLQRIRRARAQSHPGADAAGRNIVDGGLRSDHVIAQAQLADASIKLPDPARRRASSRRIWSPCALGASISNGFGERSLALGEPDPDGLIADRLSGQEPFMTAIWDWTRASSRRWIGFSGTVDARPRSGARLRQRHPRPRRLSLRAPTPPLNESSDEVSPEPEVEPAPPPAAVSAGEPGNDRRSKIQPFRVERERDRHGQHPQRFRGAPGKDLLGARHVRERRGRLSIVLNDIKRPAPGPSGPQAPQPPPAEAGDLDGVFERLRGGATRRSNEADDQYKRGSALRAAGLIT